MTERKCGTVRVTLGGVTHECSVGEPMRLLTEMEARDPVGTSLTVQLPDGPLQGTVTGHKDGVMDVRESGGK